MCITKINGIYLYQSGVLKKENLVHGFTARLGGVSTGAYESLSMSPRRGDDPKAVRENEKILVSALGLKLENLTSTLQEHTANVRVIEKEDIGRGVKTQWSSGVDGIVTTLKNVPLLCYSADCVPILFYAADIKAIGAVHAGWRGTAAQIAKNAVRTLFCLGASGENIYAAIGPCIGKCCYEVGGDVAKNFRKDVYTEKENGKYMLDLALENRMQLADAGLREEKISLSGICTSCKNELFFSHRAQHGKSGTLGGIICMRD